MLTINGLHRYYFLPHFHDMRCKAPRIIGVIRAKYNRDPLNGDVYFFMSKNCRKVKMVHFDRHAYYVHEKSYSKGYKFMKVTYVDDRPVYQVLWEDLVAFLETPVVNEIRLAAR
jgi:general stress protein 26